MRKTVVHFKKGMMKMSRDFGQEIDALRKELEALKALIPARAETPPKKVAAERHHPTHPDSRLDSLMEDLETGFEEAGKTGLVTYLGVYASGGRQSSWIKSRVCTDDLLGLIVNNTAEKVLRCIGSSDRLNILLSILKKPRTVAELVNECGFSSTGQVYHHMKPLLAADLITESESDGKGVYIFQPHKVQGIIMLLAGVCDLVDETYTKGTWE